MEALIAGVMVLGIAFSNGSTQTVCEMETVKAPGGGYSYEVVSKNSAANCVLAERSTGGSGPGGGSP